MPGQGRFDSGPPSLQYPPPPSPQMFTESEEPIAFSGSPSTEFRYSVQMGWGIFYDGETYSVISPNMKFLVQISSPRNKNAKYVEGVRDALNRIYFNQEGT